MGAEGQKLDTKAAPAAAPGEALDSLGLGIERRMQDETAAALGEPLNYEELSGDPEKLGKALERLAAAWDNAWDKLYAVFAPLGLKRDDIDAALSTPGRASEDTAEPEPEGFQEEYGQKMSWRDFKRAEHAAVNLAENPTWLDYIKAASAKYNVPVSTIVTFIEMESGFNPASKPGINPETGKPWSRAIGLAQAMPKSIESYRQQTGNPNADLLDPATAIDFLGWHLVEIVKDVNAIVDSRGAKEGFPQEYKLTTASEVKYLYMAYNNGQLGYLVLRRYLDNKTPDNFAKLIWFQQRNRGTKSDGSTLYEWETRSNYAARVGEVAKVYDAMTTGAEKYVKFDSPPLPLAVMPERRSSGYGVRTHPTTGHEHFHNGADYPAPEGTPVLAVRDGTITEVVSNWKPGNKSASGNYITVRHDDGSLSQYLHLARINATKGQRVPAGTEIGGVGSTGRSTGPHLHFIFKGPDGIPRNPEVAVSAAVDRKRGTTVA